MCPPRQAPAQSAPSAPQCPPSARAYIAPCPPVTCPACNKTHAHGRTLPVRAMQTRAHARTHARACHAHARARTNAPRIACPQCPVDPPSVANPRRVPIQYGRTRTRAHCPAGTMANPRTVTRARPKKTRGMPRGYIMSPIHCTKAPPRVRFPRPIGSANIAAHWGAPARSLERLCRGVSPIPGRIHGAKKRAQSAPGPQFVAFS